MNNVGSVIDWIDCFISDIEDAIDDYKSDIRMSTNRIEPYEKKIRIDELRRWLKVLKICREEQSQDD